MEWEGAFTVAPFEILSKLGVCPTQAKLNPAVSCTCCSHVCYNQGSGVQRPIVN